MEVTPTLRHEIEEFLYQEAHLLDEYRWREWLELLTEDIRYRIPTVEVRETADGAGERYRSEGLYLHYWDWDRRLLELRVRQFETGLNWSLIPRPVVQRMVTNIWIERADRADEVIAHSKIHVLQVRYGDKEDHWFARRVDRVRRVNGGWKLAERTVILASAVLPHTLDIFL
jgi:3-phenylpropionate/cinnamic acid dioxygenase small subunit